MGFIVQTLSDNILLSMLFTKGMTEADMRLDLEAKHGISIPDEVWSREYCSAQLSLMNREVAR